MLSLSSRLLLSKNTEEIEKKIWKKYLMIQSLPRNILRTAFYGIEMKGTSNGDTNTDQDLYLQTKT